MSEIQGKPVYGVCSCKEKVQVLSVDQVTDLIQQMAANDWQVPEEYIPKTSVNGIVEQNSKDEVELWVGTQAQYDELSTEDKNNKFAIISDDPTLATIEATLNNYGQSIENINSNITKIIDGTLIVAQAANTQNVQNVDFSASDSAVFGDYIVPKLRLLWSSSSGVWLDGTAQSFDLGETVSGKNLKVIVYTGNNNKLGEYNINCGSGDFSVSSISTVLYASGSAVTPKIGKTTFSNSGNNLIIKQLFYSLPDFAEDTYGGNEKVTAIYEVIE